MSQSSLIFLLCHKQREIKRGGPIEIVSLIKSECYYRYGTKAWKFPIECSMKIIKKLLLVVVF